MSGPQFKSGLTPSFADKAKVQMRRPTPDSDVIASSDDDHDHMPQAARPAPAALAAGGRRPSSGWLQDIQPNRKYSLPSVSLAGLGSGSHPTTPALELPQQQSRPSTSSFPWNTNSFGGSQSGTRLKEVLPSPTSVHASGDKPLPSPTNNDTDEGIAFLLNQQNPIRKSVRSQSYSIGQADLENSSLGQFSNRLRTSVRHRPSKPSLLGEGLSQLREDDIDDIESSNGSEQGIRLPPGYWEREQKQALLKQAAEQNARARHRAGSTASPANLSRKSPAGPNAMSSDYAIEELDYEQLAHSPNMSLTRRFSEHTTGTARGSPSHVGHLGESMVNAQHAALGSPDQAAAFLDNLQARRHSFATYSTHSQNFQPPNFSYNEADEDVPSPSSRPESPEAPFDPNQYFTGYGPACRAINASAISAAHPDPVIHNPISSSSNPYAVPSVLGRPGRRLFVVTFKCSRADIYYLYDNVGLELRAGDLVITEGDRGCDLGQISHADISLEEAKKHKAEALDEHFRWLVMFSQYSLAGAKVEGMLGALAKANGFPDLDRAALKNMGGQQGEDNNKPRMIKRLAQQHEIAALREKEGAEAQAKRRCALKAVEHKLPMEILDAEFQADYHKLTFFYYAEEYVNFNDLVTDVFKQYKIRIWMSAVNPASVVNPAGLNQIQPPSAIGPGAIIHTRTTNAPTAIGPGFGNQTYRQQPQQPQQPPRGRPQFNPPGGQYEDQFHPFAHQLAPVYHPQQPQFTVPQYGHRQYNQYQQQPPRYSVAPPGYYPGVTASGTPMNYNAYYPPTTYTSTPHQYYASSGPSYNSNYTAATSMPGSHATAYGGASAAGPSYGQYTSGNRYQGQYSSAGAYTSGQGYSNEYVTSAPAHDPALLTAFQNMQFSSY